jgi:ParB family chromosome partitioning protein
MKNTNSRGLGKGLSALLAEDYSEGQAANVGSEVRGFTKPVGVKPDELPLGMVVSGKFQPRTRFTDEQLNELAASIAKNGVMQPIVVRPHPTMEGKYEIIAGERRWRASQKAGLNSIPAIIRDIEDQAALELALIENVQRQDLTPVEEALGYQRLLDEFSYTQEELSSTVGKSRSHIANLLRLLALPQEIKAMLDEGSITMGHARAVLKAENPVELAQEIVRRGLNVRQAENLARGGLPAMSKKPREGSAANENTDAATAKVAAAIEKQTTTVTTTTSAAPAEEIYVRPKDADILALEETLSESLGMKVSINDKGNKGEILLSYNTLEQLDDILRRLGGL